MRTVEAQATRALGGFADGLHRRYRHRLANETLMLNELYLAVVYRPAAGMATSLVSRALAKRSATACATELTDALDACEKLARRSRASLARYEPEPLGVYRHGAVRCSSLLEYLGLLVNGEWQRMPLPLGPLNRGAGDLAPALRHRGNRIPAAVRTPGSRRMLGIKEYPTPSAVGMYNRLLSMPFVIRR